MSKGFASSYRIVLLATGMFLCLGGLAVRLVWLHVVDRDELRGTITKVRQRFDREVARRGDIYDARGAVLATSRSMIELGVDPHFLRPEDEKKWPELARLIDLPESELRRIFTTKYRTPSEQAVAISRKPATADAVLFSLTGTAAGGTEAAVTGDSDEEGSRVEANVDEQGRRRIRWAKLKDEISESLYAQVEKLDIRGVRGDRIYRRTYPSNQLASHVVGYVNKAQEPASGIEAYADFYLRGQDGWREGERDGRNRELAQFRTREVPRVDGYSVTLTLNLIVQDIVEQELAYIAEKFRPLKASIIVSDPRTGFILGMGNYPTFDLNEYNKVPKEEQHRMKNVAVADVYEPGSVFKIVAAAAAIEEKLVTPDNVLDCTLDKIMHRGRLVSLPSEDHRMGDLTVSEIISHSSNKGAAQLGIMLGEARFYDYTTKFGFGRTLGFPVGGEVPGLLTHYSKWVPVDITRITMGHSIASTVLQMHQAMSVIANDGVLLRPQIIRQINDASGAVVYRYGASELNQVISKDTARKVARMLMGVASEEGTAKEAAIAGFDVAGKTGTTQKLIEETRPDGRTRLVYSRKHHIGSFVGFFPAGAPQLMISVIVDEAKVQTPSGVAYGRLVAAPSFKRIGERLIPLLDIKSHHASPRPNFIAALEGARP